MLAAFCGNRTAAEILLFLFVNRKGYGSQIHRLLHIPLTPIQKGLGRLEKGGILTSFYEGKTRVYEFNPHYPLLLPLEELVKQAYALLSVEERKKYAVIRDQRYLASANFVKHGHRLIEFWKRLVRVREVAFVGRVHGQEGRGKAVVSVEYADPNALFFHEKGTWSGKEGVSSSFKNTFRWTLDRGSCLITLERLPFGRENPVQLLSLAPHDNGTLVSVDGPSMDGGSIYGQAFWDKENVRLTWRTISSNRNEEKDYVYT